MLDSDGADGTSSSSGRHHPACFPARWLCSGLSPSSPASSASTRTPPPPTAPPGAPRPTPRRPGGPGGALRGNRGGRGGRRLRPHGEGSIPAADTDDQLAGATIGVARHSRSSPASPWRPPRRSSPRPVHLAPLHPPPHLRTPPSPGGSPLRQPALLRLPSAGRRGGRPGSRSGRAGGPGPGRRRKLASSEPKPLVEQQGVEDRGPPRRRGGALSGVRPPGWTPRWPRRRRSSRARGLPAAISPLPPDTVLHI